MRRMRSRSKSMKLTGGKIGKFPACVVKKGDWVRAPASGKWWQVLKVRPRRRLKTRVELAVARGVEGPKREQIGWNVFFQGRWGVGLIRVSLELMQRQGLEIRTRKPRKGCA